MQFTAKQISEFINGTIEGDENAKVQELSKRLKAGSRVHCVFCRILNMKAFIFQQRFRSYCRSGLRAFTKNGEHFNQGGRSV